jgi:hypothetical protein
VERLAALSQQYRYDFMRTSVKPNGLVRIQSQGHQWSFSQARLECLGKAEERQDGSIERFAGPVVPAHDPSVSQAGFLNGAQNEGIWLYR